MGLWLFLAVTLTSTSFDTLGDTLLEGQGWLTVVIMKIGCTFGFTGLWPFLSVEIRREPRRSSLGFISYTGKTIALLLDWLGNWSISISSTTFISNDSLRNGVWLYSMLELAILTCEVLGRFIVYGVSTGGFSLMKSGKIYSYLAR